MKKLLAIGTLACASWFSNAAFAQDISGVWQQIDDQTGSGRALIEISKMPDGSYSGKIVKVTPREGYTPRATCKDCPSPYTNQPILGLSVLNNLKMQNDTNYEKGRILDPLTGKMYDARAKVNKAGNRLTLRGYMGVSALGRSQTWIRQQ